MKHLPHLIAAAAVLSAVLAACGGRESPQPPSQLVTAPQLLAQSVALPASLSGLRWDPTYELPGSPSTGPKLKLVIKDGAAQVCTLRSGYAICATIDAPVPNADIDDWSEDGTLALGYSPAEGVAALDRAAVLAFQAAVNGAAKAVVSYSAAHLAADDADCNPALKVGNPVRPHECGTTVEVPGTIPGGGIGGGIGGGGGGGGGGGIPPDTAPDPTSPTDPQPDPGMQVVVIHGPPQPVGTVIPATSVGGLWVVPNGDQLQQLTSADPKAKCVDSGIAVVCVWGKRPPVAGGEGDELRGRTPWWPQKMCDWAHIFCSEGQEPRDDARDDDFTRLPGSEVCGKTMEELYAICERQETYHNSVCEAWKPLMDYRMYKACRDKAFSNRAMCQRTASTLTGNGKHPAKCD